MIYQAKEKSACWKCVICRVRKCWEKTTLPEVNLILVIALTINSSGFPRKIFIFNFVQRIGQGGDLSHMIKSTSAETGRQRVTLDLKECSSKNYRVILNLYFLDYTETECANACGKESKQKASWLLTWACRIHLNQHLPMWFLKYLPSTVWDTRVNKLKWNNHFPYSKSKRSMAIWLENVLWHGTVFCRPLWLP